MKRSRILPNKPGIFVVSLRSLPSRKDNRRDETMAVVTIYNLVVGAANDDDDKYIEQRSS